DTSHCLGTRGIQSAGRMDSIPVELTRQQKSEETWPQSTNPNAIHCKSRYQRFATKSVALRGVCADPGNRPSPHAATRAVNRLCQSTPPEIQPETNSGASIRLFYCPYRARNNSCDVE